MLLRRWIDAAERAGVAEPNAMVLATVDEKGRPMSRSVLCKSVDETGITFFTNYDSAKGAELAANPYASATFPWYALGRQVHMRGPVSKVTAEVTADYWSKRPRGSQLGAGASAQSQPIASRAQLVGTTCDQVTARFADLDEVPVPPNWGGYLIWSPRRRVLAGPRGPSHNRIKTSGGRVERLQP